MVDLLLQATLSNLLVSTGLAVIAWIIQSRYQAASLANLLWIIVLIKMITPPLFSLPLVQVESMANVGAAKIAIERPLELPLVDEMLLPLEIGPRVESLAKASAAEGTEAGELSKQNPNSFATSLGAIWCSVSVLLFVVSLLRIVRFHLLLCQNIRNSTPRVNQIAKELASQLKLRRVPHIDFSHANVSPFVWWIGGRPKIVVPQTAIEELSERDLRFVLAHEMAHIKRRDHWVRWLEWLTVIVLWWNPVVWWARRQLRVTEEISCDAMVVESFDSQTHEYANSLLNMAEILTTVALRPPAVASAINSGGILEKRLTMIIAKKNLKLSASLRIAIAAVAICIFPIGLVYAQDSDAVERRLEKAVEAEELTPDQAKAMMKAMAQMSGKEAPKDKRANWDGRLEERKLQYEELVRELEAAVAAEKLTKEDAERKLIEIRTKLFGDRKSDDRRSDVWNEKRSGREMEEQKRRYMELVRDIEAAVVAEELSKNDAERKLIELREKMFSDERRNDDRWNNERLNDDRWNNERLNDDRWNNERLNDDRWNNERLNDDRWNNERLNDDRWNNERLNDDRWNNERAGRDLGDLKRQYIDLARELEAAVSAEKLSKEDANEMLLKLREKVNSDDRTSDGRWNEKRLGRADAYKRQLMDLARDLEVAAAAEGDSNEGADEKLIELREKMFSESDDRWNEKRSVRDMRQQKRLYVELARDIEAAVVAEELSKNDANEKLMKLREKMFGDAGREKEDEGRKLEKQKRRYLELARKIEAEVVAEKLSKKDAKEKLESLLKKLLRDRD